MNFFVYVYDGKVELVGLIQVLEFMENILVVWFGIVVEDIDIYFICMGGGFGCWVYGYYMIEVVLIFEQVQVLVKLMYICEDDMSFGIYWFIYMFIYWVVLDENNQFIGFYVKGGGIFEYLVFLNCFFVGVVDNYLVEGWKIDSNIMIGVFWVFCFNFIVGVEQFFLDEVVEVVGKDFIDFCLELLECVKNNLVGE